MSLKRIIKEEINDFDWTMRIESYSEPEYWFITNIWDKVKDNPTTDGEYPDDIFYKLNGDVVIQQTGKSKNVWLSHKIWLVFNRRFGLETEEMRRLMKGLLDGYMTNGNWKKTEVCQWKGLKKQSL